MTLTWEQLKSRIQKALEEAGKANQDIDIKYMDFYGDWEDTHGGVDVYIEEDGLVVR